MFCSTCAVRRRSVRARVPQRRVMLTGTFDYRWPLRSTIRVAFQPHEDAGLVLRARQLVEAAFESWGVTNAIRENGPKLAYSFVGVPFRPAARSLPDAAVVNEAYEQAMDKRIRTAVAAAAAVAEEPEAADERDPVEDPEVAEEPAPIEDPAEVQQAEEAQRVRFRAQLAQAREAKTAPARATTDSDAFTYDVLISVQALPLLVPQAKADSRGPSLIEFPQSQLGTYARREDFGVPTVYIGRPLAFNAAGQVPEDLQWLESPEGRFTIVHEVGHVLGLTHEHQNPRRVLRWKSKEDIAAIISSRNGGQIPVMREFIPNEITRTWAGAKRFSEWRTPAKPSEIFDSVMSKPIYRCLINQDHVCTSLNQCETEQAGYAALQVPTPGDRAQLLAMYG